MITAAVHDGAVAPEGIQRAFVDTNVLLAATDEARADHDACLGILEGWPRSGVTLYVSGQVFREYLVVATRPPAANGLGLATSDAAGNVAAFDARTTFLDETRAVHRKLVEIVAGSRCSGTQIHDAIIAATMLVHGVEVVLTGNAGDFERFAPAIQVLSPIRAP